MAWACLLKAQGRKERYTILHKSLVLFWAISVVLGGGLMAPIHARHVLSWWCVAAERRESVAGLKGKTVQGTHALSCSHVFHAPTEPATGI